jgi:hypothetical protein
VTLTGCKVHGTFYSEAPARSVVSLKMDTPAITERCAKHLLRKETLNSSLPHIFKMLEDQPVEIDLAPVVFRS